MRKRAPTWGSGTKRGIGNRQSGDAGRWRLLVPRALRPGHHAVHFALAVLLVLVIASPAAAQQVLRGRVLDALTRAPVAGAQVRFGGQDAVVLTDAQGRFRVAGAGARAELSIERVGYHALKRLLDADSAAELTLLLEPVAALHDDLVVTAARRPQRLSDAPVTTELITRREIEETGAADVASVLLERTGIEIDGGTPAGAGAMLQGFGSERVLILLDGQPLPGRIGGNFDLSRMPALQLERIEVVKGPQSTLFGSDAMGGVINLITRRPERALGLSGQILGGSEGRIDAAGHANGSVLGAAVVADIGRRRVELTPGQNGSVNALSERWDGLIKARVPGEHGELELSALLVEERQRWALGQLYNFSDNRQLALRASGVWQYAGHRFSPTLHISDFQHLSRRANSLRPPESGEAETQRIADAELLYSKVLGVHTADAGLELRRESIESERIVGSTRSLDAAEGFAQFTWQYGRMSVVPGVRFSNSEAWGSHWTPRLAVLYRPADGLALRASAGSAFRAPAFKELYIRFANIAPGVSYVVNGNPELRPETSANVSLGAELARGAWYVRAQSFYNRFDGFIETRTVGDSSGLTVFSYGNIQDGSTRGIELEAGTQWRGARLELGYSLLDARDHDSHRPLLGRPRHAGRALLGYAPQSGLKINLTGVHTRRTPLQRDSTQVALRAAFTRFDVRIAQRIAQLVELSLGLDNVLDAKPGLWPGFTGRQLYGGLSWRLGSN